jgi:hypothetical protein
MEVGVMWRSLAFGFVVRSSHPKSSTSSLDQAKDVVPMGSSASSERIGAVGGSAGMLKSIALCGVLAVLVGCSSGGRPEAKQDPLDGDGRDAYVAAFATGDGTPVVDEVAEERRCVAQVLVDVVGMDELRDVGTPREVATGDKSLAGLGVEASDEQVDEIYAGVKECGDPAEGFFRELAIIGGGELAGPVVECFKGKLDEELLRDIVVTRLVDGDTAFAEKPEITVKLTEIGRACAAAG